MERDYLESGTSKENDQLQESDDRNTEVDDQNDSFNDEDFQEYNENHQEQGQVEESNLFLNEADFSEYAAEEEQKKVEQNVFNEVDFREEENLTEEHTETIESTGNEEVILQEIDFEEDVLDFSEEDYTDKVNGSSEEIEVKSNEYREFFEEHYMDNDLDKNEGKDGKSGHLIERNVEKSDGELLQRATVESEPLKMRLESDDLGSDSINKGDMIIESGPPQDMSLESDNLYTERTVEETGEALAESELVDNAGQKSDGDVPTMKTMEETNEAQTEVQQEKPMEPTDSLTDDYIDKSEPSIIERLEILGIKEVNLRDMPNEHKKLVIEAVEEMYNDHPELKDCLGSLIMDDLDPGTEANACPILQDGALSSRIRLNSKHFNDFGYSKNLEYQKDSGFAAGIGVKSVVKHELAHILQLNLDAVSNGLSVGDKLTKYNKSNYDAMIDSWSNNTVVKTICQNALNDLGLSESDVGNELSNYAEYDEGEFFAEAISEYYTSPAPRPLSKAVVNNYKLYLQRRSDLK